MTNLWPHGRLLATDGPGHRRILHDQGVIQQVAEFLAREPVAMAATPHRSTTR